jgi:hypothetical protein
MAAGVALIAASAMVVAASAVVVAALWYLAYLHNAPSAASPAEPTDNPYHHSPLSAWLDEQVNRCDARLVWTFAAWQRVTALRHTCSTLRRTRTGLRHVHRAPVRVRWRSAWRLCWREAENG